MCAKVWSDDTLEIMEILDDTPGTHHHPSMQIHQLPKESHQTHAILPIHLTQQRRSIPPANPPYKGNTSISVTNSSASTPIPPSANHYPYPTTQTHQQRTPPPSNPPSDPPPPPSQSQNQRLNPLGTNPTSSDPIIISSALIFHSPPQTISSPFPITNRAPNPPPRRSTPSHTPTPIYPLPLHSHPHSL